MTGVTQGAGVRQMAYTDKTSLPLTERQYHQGINTLLTLLNSEELNNILFLLSVGRK